MALILNNKKCLLKVEWTNSKDPFCTITKSIRHQQPETMNIIKVSEIIFWQISTSTSEFSKYSYYYCWKFLILATYTNKHINIYIYVYE